MAADKADPPVLQLGDRWFTTSAVKSYRRDEHLINQVIIIVQQNKITFTFSFIFTFSLNVDACGFSCYCAHSFRY